MQNTYAESPGDPVRQIVARYLHAVAEAASTAARELANLPSADISDARGRRSLDEMRLGSLQEAVVRATGMDSDEGVKPRAITEELGRGDEPNVRNTLNGLAQRGITELVPGSNPQRWRLTQEFRSGRRR